MVPTAHWRDLYPEWFHSYASPDAYGRLFVRQNDDADEEDEEEDQERRLWVVHVDRGAEVTVFLVHGAGGRGEQFLPMITLLMERTEFNIVVPDLLGHGRSAKPSQHEAYATGSLVMDVEALLEALGTEDNRLIGHSLGSAICMHIAARCSSVQAVQFRSAHRKPVTSLVLIGTCADAPGSANSPLLLCCNCFLECVRPVLSMLSRKMLFSAAYDAEAAKAESAVSYQNPFDVIRGLGKFLDWPGREAQELIEVPVLVLNGKADAVTPSDGAAQLQHTIDRARVIFVDGSHNLHQEAPNRCTQEIVAFWSE